MNKILYIKQTDLKDCGVACLLAIVRFYGGYVTREYLRDLTKTTNLGVSVYSLVEASKKLGFEARALKSKLINFKDSDFPMIAHVVLDKKYGHFVVLIKSDKKGVTIMDPSKGIYRLSFNEWKNITTNVYILYKPKMKILKQNKEANFYTFLYPILKKYKFPFFLILLFSIIYTICNILLSYQFQFFLDLVNDNIIKTIHLIFYVLVIIIILKELTNLFRNSLINYLNHQLDKTLICEIYEHILKLPYLYFKNRMKGDMITRIQDVFVIREVISKFFVTITIDLFMISFVFITSLSINKKLTFLVLIITTFYVLIMLFYNHVIKRKIMVMKDKEALFSNHLIESLTSPLTIKGMQIEDWLKSRLILKYEDYQDESFQLYKRCYQENFFKELIYGIGLLLVIYVGVLEVLDGNFTLAKLLVFNSLLGYYFTPIQNICSLQVLIQESRISFIRIKELLSIQEEKIDISDKYLKRTYTSAITIRNLEYSYNGINQVLKCLKLDIPNASRVLFYGNSGGGKSTLMKLLCRYIENFQGEIKIDNKNINYYSLKQLREKVLYVSQDETIYTDTVYNNIVLNHEISYQKYLEIIELTGVSKLIEKSMLKDDMLLDNNASNLSGGEKQRIILARSLVKNSDIYIFDESFSALDIKSERIILKKIFEYLKNKTILVISHRFNNRDLYQKFVLIEKGILYEY